MKLIKNPNPEGWSPTFKFRNMGPDEVARKKKSVTEASTRLANELRKQGYASIEIIGPRETPAVESVSCAAVKMELDWKLSTKREMVESARDLMTNASFLYPINHVLPTILAAVIEGRGLYEYGIGEFFLLCGKFEQKHQTTGQQTRTKMEALVKGDTKYLKAYKEYGKEHLYPLPYAVRNILAHIGTNPNSLDPDGQDLRTSIDLLREWVK